MLYFAVVLNYLLLLNFLHGLFLLWLLGFIVVTLIIKCLAEFCNIQIFLLIGLTCLLHYTGCFLFLDVDRGKSATLLSPCDMTQEGGFLFIHLHSISLGVLS